MDSSNPHGETKGWYDYTSSANLLVNKLCRQFETNSNLATRIVKSNQYQYSLVYDWLQFNFFESNPTFNFIHCLFLGFS